MGCTFALALLEPWRKLWQIRVSLNLVNREFVRLHLRGIPSQFYSCCLGCLCWGRISRACHQSATRTAMSRDIS